MRVLFLHLVFTLPRKLRTSPRVPTYLDNRNAALLQTLDLTVHDLDRLFNEVKVIVNLDFIQRYSKGFVRHTFHQIQDVKRTMNSAQLIREFKSHDLISHLKLKGFSSYVGIALLTIMGGLDTSLNLNNFLGCLMNDLWASELTISNFSLADR
ncbi:hypothetical protein Tco_1548390 [Tanacetum coccineum]